MQEVTEKPKVRNVYRYTVELAPNKTVDYVLSYDKYEPSKVNGKVSTRQLVEATLAAYTKLGYKVTTHERKDYHYFKWTNEGLKVVTE